MAKHQSTTFSSKLAPRRIWIQAAFLLVWLDPLMLRMHTMCSPVFHCYSCPLALFACPIGVLANFSAIHVFPFIALGVVALTGALLGSFICGWLCPFGLFQDLVGRIPTPKFTLPTWLGYCRYVVLVVLVLAVPYWFGESHALFFCRLCPAGALEAAFPNTARLAIAGEPIVWPTAPKIAIFGVLLAAMLFTWRPWCAVLCPLGAIYSLCNWFSFIFLRVRKDGCNACDRCRSTCRYSSGPRDAIASMRCIGCLDCTTCGAVEVSSVLSRSPQDNKTETPPSVEKRGTDGE